MQYLKEVYHQHVRPLRGVGGKCQKWSFDGGVVRGIIIWFKSAFSGYTKGEDTFDDHKLVVIYGNNFNSLKIDIYEPRKHGISGPIIFFFPGAVICTFKLYEAHVDKTVYALRKLRLKLNMSENRKKV